jgi:hypothetical protein
MKKSVFIISILILTAVVGSLIFQTSHQAAIEQTQNQILPEAQESGDAQIRRKQKIAAEYGKLPLNFEPNVGQTDEQVKFLARGHGYSLFLTGNEAVLSLQKRGKTKAEDKNAVVKMQIQGANASPKASGLDETGGKSNYFIGNNPEKWQTEVPNYKQVKYEQIYSGVDLVYYGNGQQLEYDFLVQPNANPEQIKLKFDGVKSAKIEQPSGDLLLKTNAGTIRQHKPFVYQNIDGERREIASSYAIQNSKFKIQNSKIDDFVVSFNLAAYDKSKELVIDPILAYGSYLGGNAFDEGRSVAVDAQGNAYVVGTAASRDFPTTAGTIKPVLLPRLDAPNSYWYDAFVTKINADGTAIVYSTYFGGRNGSEIGLGAGVDANGNVFLTGNTMASDLPLVNPLPSSFTNIDTNFAAKLNSTGSAIIFSTYLGVSNGGLNKIAVNQTTGESIFVGTTSTPNFPTTAGAYKERLCDTPQSCSGVNFSGSYIVKFSPGGTAVFSTLFPASINDVALDASDNVIVGGTAAATFPTTPGAFQPATSGGIEGFVAKLTSNGSALAFGTFLGGGLQSDRVKGVAVDSTGNIYVTGQTQNGAFPTTAGVLDQTYNGGEDGFVTKFNPQGTALIYSTFLGGAGKDEPFAIGVGTDDSAFITGETTGATTFPLRNSLNGTSGTIFLTRLNPQAGALVFSTILGQGGGYDLAVDASNNAYVTGHTTRVLVSPTGFQTVKPGDISDKDAYIVKIAPTDENQTFYSISGSVIDENKGYNNDYTPIVVTVTGAVNRSINLPYNGGQYSFGVLPAGGNYTITVRKNGYLTSPQSETFNNLGANQFADFTILRNEAPVGVVTSPAHGTNYNAPATIAITATASDPDGDAITKVDFVAYSSETGIINIGTDTTAPYEITWQNVPVGTFSIDAIPTDAKGLRGYSTPVVHVFVNDAAGLSVSITSPTEGQSFAQGTNVPLSANVSSSVRILEFYDQDNNLIGRRTEAPWSTTHRFNQVGNYTVTAKVFNSQGDFLTSDPVSFSITPLNHQITGRLYDLTLDTPITNATVNLTSASNPNVTATATTDAGGNYMLTDLGLTPDDSVTLTPVANGYSFEPQTRTISYLGFIHWDTQNFWGTRVTQINVALTSPTQGQIFTAPATINLAANATSGAGSITKVEFMQRRGAVVTLVGTDTSAPYEFQATNVAAGFGLAYFARATDSTGAVTDSAEVGVTVNETVATVRLQGDINSPGNEDNPIGSPMQGITVRLTGTANGNPITQTSVSNVNGAYGFFNIPRGGNYTITPVGVGGMTFTPPSVTITNATEDNLDIDFVSSAANQSPTVQINSPANGAVFTMPVAIPVNVTASDVDGNIVHLTVSAVDSQMSTTIGQANNGTFSAPWQPTRPGNYRLWAQARDNGGFNTSVFIDITVVQPSPTSISGRIVNRDSEGIAGVTMELREYPVPEENPPAPITATTDANGNYTIPNITTFKNYVLKAVSLDHTFSPQQRLFFNLAASQTNADFTGTLQVQRSDFDGDGQSDIAVWRPDSGVWYVNRSTDNTYSSVQFGGESFGDVAVPGNFDGDKKTDYAVFRHGIWYVMNSSNGQTKSVQFGFADDKPVAGDYDGDGKTDIAVWRPETGVWYIQRSSDASYDIRQFGLSGDTPLVGDYDGDGKTDLTIWRPSTGVWYVLQSTDGNARTYQFGVEGDTPLVGDFDGDKRADYTIFRPSTGVWYVNLSSNGGFKILQWGIGTDIPVPGDFDRDGKTDFGVFRKSEGNWYVFKSSDNSYVIQQFGLNGDMPIPAAYR